MYDTRKIKIEQLFIIELHTYTLKKIQTQVLLLHYSYGVRIVLMQHCSTLLWK